MRNHSLFMLMKIFQDLGLENSVRNWNVMGPQMIYYRLIIFRVNCLASGVNNSPLFKETRPEASVISIICLGVSIS